MRLDDSHVYMTHVDNQTVVLDIKDSSYLTVNEAGTVLLDALRGDTPKRDLVKKLQRHFNLPEDVALRDCEAFLAQLSERGWLLDGDNDGSLAQD